MAWAPIVLNNLGGSDIGELSIQAPTKFFGEAYVFDSLSGSGTVPISKTSTPGNLVYSTSTLFKNEFWMYAHNSGVDDRVLTLEFGGVSTTDQFQITIPGQTFLKPVLPGMLLGNGKDLRAFADATDFVTLTGNVHKW